MTAVHETAYPRIRSHLTDRELQALYTPTPDALAFIARATKSIPDIPICFLRIYSCGLQGLGGRMTLRTGLFALGVLVLGGCITWPVDEPYFFAPQPVASKAAHPGQMRLEEQEKITGPFADARYLDGRSPLLAGRLPAKVTHDLVALGGERIALTRVKAANGADDEPLIRLSAPLSSIGAIFVFPWESLTISSPSEEMVRPAHPPSRRQG